MSVKIYTQCGFLRRFQHSVTSHRTLSVDDPLWLQRKSNASLSLSFALPQVGPSTAARAGAWGKFSLDCSLSSPVEGWAS